MTPRDRISVHEGDITRLEVDAIVNAANEQLMRGGGVCGAIFAAAGPKLDTACAGLGGCPTGDAKITPGFGLPARHVIHAVGPVWYGGTEGEPERLASCYRRALELAAENGCRSVAFPAISTGIFGYPADRAADIAVGTVVTFLAGHDLPENVILCCFGARSAETHQTALKKL